MASHSKWAPSKIDFRGPPTPVDPGAALGGSPAGEQVAGTAAAAPAGLAERDAQRCCRGQTDRRAS